MTDKELEKGVGDFVTKNYEKGYSAFAMLVKDGIAQVSADGATKDIVAGLVDFINRNGFTKTFIELLMQCDREKQKRNN